VRIGRGSFTGGEDAAEKEPKVERSALEEAEARISALQAELRKREDELSGVRSEKNEISVKMQELKENLESEKKAFYEGTKREAESAREAAEKEGRDAGYAKGYSEGMTKAETAVRKEYEDKFADALAMLANMLASVKSSRDKLAEAHAPQLIRLWETMLEKMLRVKTRLMPNTAYRVLQNILERVSDRERIVIYLSAADIDIVEAGKDKLMDAIRGVKSLEILSDESVERGSCLVETNLGIYDARWKTQLEQISAEVETLISESIAEMGEGSASDGE
jgi:flagellar assembly protein FliH